MVGCHASVFPFYLTETRTTPDCIIPNARAALIETSITRPRTNGPRSLMRSRME
jgi:hypothetical protein